jgi:hypothetical protein
MRFPRFVNLFAVALLFAVFGYAPESALADGVPASGSTDSKWACHGTVRRKNGTEAPFKLKNIGPTDTINGAANIVRARHKAAGATTQQIDCYHYSDSEPSFTDDDGLAGGDDADIGGPWSKYKACSDQHERDRSTCNSLPKDDKELRALCWTSAMERLKMCNNSKGKTLNQPRLIVSR